MANLTRLEDIKMDLKSLLMSRNSQDITLPFLNKLYKDISEEDIPYRDFYYTSLKQFLDSMPDVLYLKTNRNNDLCAYHVETERSRHISRLVSLENKKDEPQNRKMLFRANAVHPRVLNHILLESCSLVPHDYSGNKKIKKTDVLSSIKNRIEFYTAKDLNNQLNELNHVLFHNETYIYLKTEFFENRRRKESSDSSEDAQVTESTDEELKNVTTDDSISDLIKQSTQTRLKKLIEKYPQGIKCWELPEIYRREYKIELEYIDLGFNSIIEFVGALPNILKLVTPPNITQHVIVGADTAINSYRNCQRSDLTCENKLLENVDEIEPLPIKLSDNVAKSLVSDKFLFNETIDQIDITSMLGNGENDFDIIVSEAYDPSFFWIHLKQNNKIINTLMEHLQEFYSVCNLDSYKIPPILIKPGLHVACEFNSQWHRGIIKEINPKGPEIHFYDYGTNCIYNLNDLYFLDKRFSRIPAQAIPCTLHNVKPVGCGIWSRDVCKKFINRVFDKSFIARVVSIDYERNSLVINLIDSNYDLNIININDWMIKNNIARWGTPLVHKTIFTLKHFKEF